MDNSFNLIIDLCSFLPSVSYKNYKNIKINLKIISKILNPVKKRDIFTLRLQSDLSMEQLFVKTSGCTWFSTALSKAINYVIDIGFTAKKRVLFFYGNNCQDFCLVTFWNPFSCYYY